jgi:hypothetical protein
MVYLLCSLCPTSILSQQTKTSGLISIRMISISISMDRLVSSCQRVIAFVITNRNAILLSTSIILVGIFRPIAFCILLRSHSVREDNRERSACGTRTSRALREAQRAHQYVTIPAFDNCGIDRDSLSLYQHGTGDAGAGDAGGGGGAAKQDTVNQSENIHGGGRDGTGRADVRQAGCSHMYDSFQNNTTLTGKKLSQWSEVRSISRPI